MAEPLRVGLAGLGTVGSAVAAMLASSQTALAERTGRGITLVAYASKDPPKDATLDLSGVRKVADPITLARDPGIENHGTYICLSLAISCALAICFAVMRCATDALFWIASASPCAAAKLYHMCARTKSLDTPCPLKYIVPRLFLALSSPRWAANRNQPMAVL